MIVCCSLFYSHLNKPKAHVICPFVSGLVIGDTDFCFSYFCFSSYKVVFLYLCSNACVYAHNTFHVFTYLLFTYLFMAITFRASFCVFFSL